MLSTILLAATLSLVTGSGDHLSGADGPPGTATGERDVSIRRRIPANLLEPLPTSGGIPPIVRDPTVPSPKEMALRADARDYAKQIDRIARQALRQRNEAQRQSAFEELAEFTDPAALPALVAALSEADDDDVRLWLLNHLASLGDHGQAAMAMTAITTTDRGFRDTIAAMLDRPPSPSVLMAIDAGLRDQKHDVVNAAGWLAGQVNAIEAIPPMIFGQAIGTPIQNTGDLAWIAIGTTTTYVANLVPVVGGSAGAFQPVIGTIREGTLLRVMDAVVVSSADQRGGPSDHRTAMRNRRTAVVYRIDLHNALVAMTSAEWGRSTAHLGYDMQQWYRWFNEEFVPHMRERDAIARIVDDVDE